MTDDPLKAYTAIGKLQAGSYVTFLSTYINQNGQCWDYIEATVSGKTVRGFVPSGNLNIPFVDNIGK